MLQSKFQPRIAIATAKMTASFKNKLIWHLKVEIWSKHLTLLESILKHFSCDLIDL